MAMTDVGDLPELPDPRVHPTLTVPEAGRFLGLARASAYEGAHRGDIPTIRIGRRLLVPTAVLARMLGIIDGDGSDGAATGSAT